MNDRILPGVGLEAVTASPSVNRLALMDEGFRRWVASRVYRHLCCDWGVVPGVTAEQNFASVVLGGPLVSRWPFDGDALVIVHDSTHERASVVLESEGRYDFSGPQHQEV